MCDQLGSITIVYFRKKSYAAREQPPRICKNNKSKINCESAIGQHITANPECAKNIQTTIFGSLGKQDRLFI